MSEKSPDVEETARLHDQDDIPKIKFTSDDKKGKNGEAKVDIEGGIEQQFVGLTKEELMKYANDPFWVRLRLILFVLFWVVWVAMLVGAIFIIIVWPKCASPPPLQWYQEEPLYQVDLDAKNGPNDLDKLVGRLDNVVSLGASAIILNPILLARDNWTIPRPNVGTASDIAEFVAKANDKNVRVILEIDASEGNFNTPEGRNTFVRGMQYWLEKGVNGFSVLNAASIPHVDEVVVPTAATDGATTNDEQQQAPANEGMLADIRRMFDSFPKSVFMADARSSDYAENAGRFFGSASRPLVHVVTTHQLASSQKPTADELVQVFSTAQNATPAHGWAAFVISDRNGQRLADRVGPSLVDAIHMITTMAHGTPILQHGDEYGLKRSEELPETGGGNTSETTQHEKHFRVYQMLTKLRKEQNALKQGDAHFKALKPEVFAMSRVRKGSPGFLVAVNLSPEVQVVNLRDLGAHIPDTGHADVVSSNSFREIHVKTDFAGFEMKPEESVVMQFVPKLD